MNDVTIVLTETLREDYRRFGAREAGLQNDKALRSKPGALHLQGRFILTEEAYIPGDLKRVVVRKYNAPLNEGRSLVLNRAGGFGVEALGPLGAVVVVRVRQVRAV